MASINRRDVGWVIPDNIYVDLVKSNMYNSYYRINKREVLFYPPFESQNGDSYLEWKRKEAEKKALGLKRFL